jgi:hypothetical protein
MQVLLAGLLLVAGRSAAAQGQPAAQAADTTPLQIVFVVYPDTTAADQAMAKLSAAQRGHVESYQVVSEDKQGNLKTQQKHDKAGNSAPTQRASNTSDGVVALLGERPQRDTSTAGRDTSAQGYAPGKAGGNASGISAADQTRMQDMLTPGQAAVILVVEDPYGKDLQSAMQKDNGTGGMVVELVPVPQ